MIRALEKQLSEIFERFNIRESFKIYDCTTDKVPKQLEHIVVTHEFIVCCEHAFDKKDLQTFLRKEIHIWENLLYWFEGDTIEIQVNNKCSELKPIDLLKKETCLPQWLDDFIFNHLGGEYSPDFSVFDYNLNLEIEDTLIYLGTYFPRSYAESFCIFDNVFQNENYKRTLQKSVTFQILSIGVGTGGDLLGLLITIRKHFSPSLNLIIYILDGNFNALNICQEIVDKFKIHYSMSISLKVHNITIDEIANIDIEKIAAGGRFDYIISSKMICEVMAINNDTHNKSYYDFILKFLPLLSEYGICLLLDVTTKVKNKSTFNPILMNQQINVALKELNGCYKTILPLPCGCYEQMCDSQCFTQQEFVVTHSRKARDKSRVCYRILTNTTFAKELVYYDAFSKYAIQNKGDIISAFCPYSSGKNVVDGYKLDKY